MKEVFSRALKLTTDIEDFGKVELRIRKDLSFQGTNLWILIFAIFIACVGLNINSYAVIVGAMLISPLMGPINGMGYSIATHNFQLFKQSVKNLCFAVVGSILASTVYFFISPLSNPTSEILLRTSPTIYDVVIAFFGGLAGMIAIGSRQKGNIIPGVAIATTLLPPLCIAGFGIANLQLHYLLSSLYLFVIYTVFMTISGVVMAHVIGFPERMLVDEGKKKSVNRWMGVILVVTLAPSVYLGYQLVRKDRFTTNAGRYIEKVSVISNNYLLNSSVDSKNRIIELTYGGSSLSPEQKREVMEQAESFSLDDATINISEGFSFERHNTSQGNINDKESMLKAEVNKLNLQLHTLALQNDSLQLSVRFGKIILSEISAFYPNIQKCAYSETLVYSNVDSLPTRQGLILIYSDGLLPDEEKVKIENWLGKRIPISNFYTHYVEVEQ